MPSGRFTALESLGRRLTDVELVKGPPAALRFSGTVPQRYGSSRVAELVTVPVPVPIGREAQAQDLVDRYLAARRTQAAPDRRHPGAAEQQPRTRSGDATPCAGTAWTSGQVRRSGSSTRTRPAKSTTITPPSVRWRWGASRTAATVLGVWRVLLTAPNGLTIVEVCVVERMGAGQLRKDEIGGLSPVSQNSQAQTPAA